jgi:drug/metabolite transporter (DMT)-like permease
VNAPPWEFGQLLGLYVVFFFVTSQVIAWVVFKQSPTLHSTIAAVLIVAGGVVFSLERK